jgi:hypothetical protein
MQTIKHELFNAKTGFGKAVKYPIEKCCVNGNRCLAFAARLIWLAAPDLV